MAQGGDGAALKLIMEKGPLAGEVRCFRSGSEVKIGRIARGNSVAIKDGGISSKHILIRFDSHPGRVGNWIISDLGSSNGTFLNGQSLDPFTPAQLSDGDVIKIGEWTSVVVKFEDVGVDAEESKVRRNPTRRGRNLAVVDKNNEVTLGKDDQDQENVRGQIGRGKAALRNNEIAEDTGFNEGEKRVTRNTARNRQGTEGEVGNNEIAEGKEFNEGEKRVTRSTARNRRGAEGEVRNNEVEEGQGLKEGEKRVTRSTVRNRKGTEGEVGIVENLGRKACSRRNLRKKEEKLGEDGVREAEEMKYLAQNEVQEGENSNGDEVRVKAKGMQEESLKNGTRSMEKEQNLKILRDNGHQNSESGEMVLPIEEKDGENVKLRKNNRSLRKEVNLDSLGENGRANNKRGRGRRGKRNVGMETLTENNEGAEIGNEENVEEKLNSKREVLEEEKNNSQVLQEEAKCLAGLVDERVQFAAGGSEELASTSGVKENIGDEVDLEKMTLGEWFDYLDVHLPKQIIDATEEMILEMKQKAEKFHDFMLEQKNAKSTVELPVG